MVNKKAVLIATIVAVLVIGVIFAFNVNKLDKENSDVEENKNASSNVNVNVNANETETNKNVENNVTDENTTNTTAEENTVKEDEENTNTSNTTTENENTSSNKKEDKTGEYEVSAEGAIKLLKTKIKQRSNTYFYTEDEISEGVYIISLRDETTTAEIASYKVDVKNKTVTEN